MAYRISTPSSPAETLRAAQSLFALAQADLAALIGADAATVDAILSGTEASPASVEAAHNLELILARAEAAAVERDLDLPKLVRTISPASFGAGRCALDAMRDARFAALGEPFEQVGAYFLALEHYGKAN